MAMQSYPTWRCLKALRFGRKLETSLRSFSDLRKPLPFWFRLVRLWFIRMVSRTSRPTMQIIRVHPCTSVYIRVHPCLSVAELFFQVEDSKGECGDAYSAGFCFQVNLNRPARS